MSYERFLRIATVLFSTCVLVATLSACASSAKRGGTSRVRVVHLSASWATYYKDLPSLARSADLIMSGEVVSRDDPVTHSKSDDDPAYYTTESYVKVKHIIESADGQPDSIAVVQTGGTVDGVEYQIDDDPLFAPHSQVLLFLRRNSDGSYQVSGGPSGRFTVAAGLVSSFAKDAVPVDGVGLAQFEQNVKAAL